MKGTIFALGLGFLVATLALPSALATNPPGPICSGTVALNCYYCSPGTYTGGYDPYYCYENYTSFYWKHCSLWVANFCYLG